MKYVADKRILLIDDDPFALKLLSHQLRILAHENITLVDNASEALALISMDLHSVDLIFCDLQMPEMDGVEFLRYLSRLNYPGGLVLVSGEEQRILDSVQRLANAHTLNVLDVVHKPITSKQLAKILSRHFRSLGEAPTQRLKTYDPDELRLALRDSELVNYYQPKVNIATGEVKGIETLVRWQHPEDGLVFPDQFIYTAEQSNQIDQLTSVVLENALKQLQIWRQSGFDFHMAINASMDNLACLDFPDRLIDAVNEANVPLASIILEVTESRFMRDRQASLDVLTRLRLKRVSLSIDDFGTGHSSLAQLCDIPFDELKIDKCFVHNAGLNVSRKAIFEASLGMARQLRIKTVAEGVENEEDWIFLQASKCDLAQGNFIGKAMPPEAFEQWLIDWKKRFKEMRLKEILI
jgi:EAL domain-containing protein (putative c-di-GMP-specific phosphodiesterase class I)/AmiR/NasT family two-component response regulator